MTDRDRTLLKQHALGSSTPDSVKSAIHSKLRAADALADEVAVLVQRGKLDERSPAADALLDYREPPRTERTDRIAELEEDNERLRAKDAERLKTLAFVDKERHHGLGRASVAEDRIDAALALHVQDREEGEDVHGCLGCHEEWPCPTVEALKGEGESPEPLTAEGCMCPCHHVGGQPQIGTCEDCDSMHKGEGEKSPRRRLILGVADQLAEDAEDLEKP